MTTWQVLSMRSVRKLTTKGESARRVREGHGFKFTRFGMSQSWLGGKRHILSIERLKLSQPKFHAVTSDGVP